MTKPRYEFLALAEQCGARLTGKPDGSESITIIFTIAAWRAFDKLMAEPIDMVLFCPACGMQHIDAPEFNGPREDKFPAFGEDPAMSWTNPPHRSHLCAGCGYVWRPADVPTNGVAAIKTVGRADSPFGADKRVALTDGDEKATANQALGECMYAALPQPAAPAAEQPKPAVRDEGLRYTIRRVAAILRGGEGVQDQGEAYDLALKVLDAALSGEQP